MGDSRQFGPCIMHVLHSGYKYIIIAKTQCSGRTWCDSHKILWYRELAFDGEKFSACVFVLQPLSFFTSVFIIIKINVIKFCVY